MFNIHEEKEIIIDVDIDQWSKKQKKQLKLINLSVK